jgi:hypothetical protein
MTNPKTTESAIEKLKHELDTSWIYYKDGGLVQFRALINKALSEAERRAALAFMMHTPSHLRGKEITEYKDKVISGWISKHGAKI